MRIVIRIHRGEGVEVLTGDGSLLLKEVELSGACGCADKILEQVGLRLGLDAPRVATALSRSREVTKDGMG